MTNSPASGIGLQWHNRLGHPGPKVIKHLPPTVEVLDPSLAPSTIECEPYTLAKATNIVSRRPIAPPEYPFYRISVDWFAFTKSLNGYNGGLTIRSALTSTT